ncbi:MAG TPA: CBS domain-containing protein [Stellaceae bacterium]|nr:CBS domain-containing protein [Stellaceae bacterium]
MRIAEILRRKGSAVSSIRSVDTVDSAIHKLSELRVGALVVLDRWGKFVGVLSERDILYALDRHGKSLLVHRVEEIMNPDVTTCAPDDRADQVMALMTAHRVRHLPVLDHGHLSGIVSIGDLVKHRLQEMEQEANVLREMGPV